MSITQPVLFGQPQGDGRRGGLPAAPGDGVDRSDGPLRPRDQGIDQGRLADSGVTDENAAATVERRSQVGQVGAGPGHGDPDTERGVLGHQDIGSGEIGLGQAEQRNQPGVVAGHQDAVDHAGPRRRIGQGGDDHQLVGVGHDRPLVRVVVVRGSPQHCAALLDLDDPGQGPGLTGGVADDPDPVTDDDRRPAELPRLGGRHVAVVQQRAVATAVDGHHGGDLGGAVVGAILRAGPGPASRALERVVFVGTQVPRRHDPADALPDPASETVSEAASASPSIRVHNSTNSGMVLATQPMSSISTSSTTSPSSAPAWAIR